MSLESTVALFPLSRYGESPPNDLISDFAEVGLEIVEKRRVDGADMEGWGWRGQTEREVVDNCTSYLLLALLGPSAIAVLPTVTTSTPILHIPIPALASQAFQSFFPSLSSGFEEEDAEYSGEGEDEVEELADLREARSPQRSARDSSASPYYSTSPKQFQFKALSLPSTHLAPDISPRLSKAAALRMGITPDTSPRTRVPSIPSEPNLHTPGYRRELAEEDIPKSISAPAITPRQTKASSLREGKPLPEKKIRRESSQEKDLVTPGVNQRPLEAHEIPKSIAPPAVAVRESRASILRRGGDPTPEKATRILSSGSSSTDTFANTPGHKRLLSIQVESVKEPTFKVRMTKAAQLRTGADDSGSPSSPPSKSRNPVNFDNTPGHKRLSTPITPPKSIAPPTIIPRGTKASSLRTGGSGSGGLNMDAKSITTDSYFFLPKTNSSSISLGQSPSPPRSRASLDGVPGRERKGVMNIQSTKPPAIAPRMTKAAQLRTGSGSATPTMMNGRLRRVVSLDGVTEEDGEDEGRDTFTGVPGHRRAEKFVVKSTSAPKIPPRLTKAASLRLSAGGTPSAPQVSETPKSKKRASLPPPSSFFNSRPNSKFLTNGGRNASSENLARNGSSGGLNAKKRPSTGGAKVNMNGDVALGNGSGEEEVLSSDEGTVKDGYYFQTLTA